MARNRQTTGKNESANDEAKTHVNATEVIVWDMGKRDVFEAVASGGAGDPLLPINVLQTKSDDDYVFDGLICDRSRQQGLP